MKSSTQTTLELSSGENALSSFACWMKYGFTE